MHNYHHLNPSCPLLNNSQKCLSTIIYLELLGSSCPRLFLERRSRVFVVFLYYVLYNESLVHVRFIILAASISQFHFNELTSTYDNIRHFGYLHLALVMKSYHKNNLQSKIEMIFMTAYNFILLLITCQILPTSTSYGAKLYQNLSKLR